MRSLSASDGVIRDRFRYDAGVWTLHHSHVMLNAGNVSFACWTERVPPHLNNSMARHSRLQGIRTSFGAPAAPQRPYLEIDRIESGTRRGVGVQLPLWQTAAVTGVLAVFLAEKRRRRHRRRRVGLCVYCGYDLRADRRQCPECGRLSDYSDWTGSARHLPTAP